MDLLKSIAHPEEVYALLKYKFGNSPTNTQHADTVGASFTSDYSAQSIKCMSLNNVVNLRSECIVTYTFG